MSKIQLVVLVSLIVFVSGAGRAETLEELADQVRSAEISFAKTMADRDLEAFASFLSEEALFFGGQDVLRGKEAIKSGWSSFFTGELAPFSWEPEVVEVLDSGDLALSTGPVWGAAGKQIGSFNSIWQRGSDGSWKVVFDKGCPHCE